MSVQRISRRALMLAAGAATFAGKALAQAAAFPVRLYGQTNQLLRGGPIGIPSYQIAYFTSSQGTAVAGIGVNARLTSTLANVPQEVMRGLVDEGYADLKAKFEAAGLPVLAQPALNADLASAGVEYVPDNAEITKIGRGVTIGQSVRKAYAAFGAKDAPMIKQLHSVAAFGGMGALNAMGVNSKLGEVAKKHQGVLVMPCLVVDFAKTDARGGGGIFGGGAANVSSRLSFTMTLATKTSLVTSMNNGRASAPGNMFLRSELSVPTPFGTVLQGQGAVRALLDNTSVNSYYIEQENSRGDAVEVNIPVWQGLVRDAFKALNTAVVEEFKKARG